MCQPVYRIMINCMLSLSRERGRGGEKGIMFQKLTFVCIFDQEREREKGKREKRGQSYFKT